MEEAAPEEHAAMLASLPAPARVLWHLIGKHQYARRIARIRAGIAA